MGLLPLLTAPLTLLHAIDTAHTMLQVHLRGLQARDRRLAKPCCCHNAVPSTVPV